MKSNKAIKKAIVASFRSDYNSDLLKIEENKLDGKNKEFRSVKKFIPSTLQVFLNGVLQTPGSNNDYVTSGKRTIMFLNRVSPRDSLIFKYIKAKTKKG